MVNKFKTKGSNKEDKETRNGFPLVGDYFPEISVQTTHGRRFLPSDYSGWWFVLFSHPGDFTPVCTTEFVSFAKNYHRFKDLHCELIGLSVDQVFSHIKWVQWIERELNVEIPFPIIADDSLRVSKALGMIHPQKGSNTVRAVFIVDDNGYIRTILYYPQEIGRNIKEILRTVKALKTADDKESATPANWPENELIGDRIIVPPAESVEQAEENKGKYECYDWWFCHRKNED